MFFLKPKLKLVYKGSCVKNWNFENSAKLSHKSLVPIPWARIGFHQSKKWPMFLWVKPFASCSFRFLRCGDFLGWWNVHRIYRRKTMVSLNRVVSRLHNFSQDWKQYLMKSGFCKNASFWDGKISWQFRASQAISKSSVRCVNALPSN